MPMEFTGTLTSVGTSLVVVIPKPIIEGFKLKKGDKMKLQVSEGGIFIPLEAP